ncbi:hypothetical protein BHU72_12215 [Desulfuribacillus stibiiarsenatis]|uniref:Intracellular proteinase inhibitor BsuPI domain-containing protein n=1 Tax=Desulfuribacillus stibiiarsenatis TaxID=1390249 RepID=A0A1E5L206_9FIRM|nr:hypothetical protein [Desulfuribacillus stibiiarsenatis]OEH84165.1 hypothetical protein BHU72_12215 [Desulfuribacillus stibiiarsenatis]
MNRLFVVILMVVSLVFGIVGCGESNDGQPKLIEDPKVIDNPEVVEESKQVGEFEVTIQVKKDKQLAVMATVTYVGDKNEIDIYHGGSIFFFNIYQKDGDFEYIGAMNQPLITTTLIRNEPHTVAYTGPELERLKPGTYEFEAVANFATNIENIIDSNFNVPVSTIVKID